MAYRVLIGSQKGGTGQTTSVLALAHALGGMGKKVLVWDADSLHSATLVAAPEGGACPWPNVSTVASSETERPADEGFDVVLVDGPALTESTVQPILREVHGVILTALADPLSLRTVRAAGGVFQDAKKTNPKLELLGMLVAMYTPEEQLQTQMLGMLRKDYARLVIEPPIPFDQALADWPLEPGSPLPDGPGGAAYRRIAEQFARRLSKVGAKPA